MQSKGASARIVTCVLTHARANPAKIPCYFDFAGFDSPFFGGAPVVVDGG